MRYGSKCKMNPNKTLAKTELALKNFKIPEKRHGYYFYVVPKVLDLMRCNLTENDAEAIYNAKAFYVLRYRYRGRRYKSHCSCLQIIGK